MRPTHTSNQQSKPKPMGRKRVLFYLFLSVLLICALACGKRESDKTAASSSNSKAGGKQGAVANGKFTESIPQQLALPGEGDEVGMRVLRDYGAMFVARGDAVPPPVIVFADEAAVRQWQSSVRTTRAEIADTSVELQSPALTALMEARTEAQAAKLDITPRAPDAARRSYEDTVRLWLSRVNPALTHWANEQRLPREEAERIRALSPREQIPEILRLEADGLFFNTDFTKSILYSVAAPGTSQHLSMLAFDVKENENARVRGILARHGWFQTIISDTPHFTFLGVKEEELPGLGLKKVTNGGRVFWIPDL